MRYRLLWTLWLSSWCCLLAAQTPLTGKVIAADTKQPIPAASVFLSNTSIGTVTDSKGLFAINRIPTGRFDLVVSCIGYETQVQTIGSNQVPNSLLISLRPKAKELDEVVVEQYDKDGWDKWGNFFIESLIGTSAYAQDCKLKNPGVVKFRYSKKLNTLKAFADEALVIENKALGYTLRYQLTKFEYNYGERLFYYQGYPLFQEMVAKRKAQKQRWQAKREDAYTGSMMHFMRSLYRNRVIEEGFEIRRLIKMSDAEKKRVKIIQQARIAKMMANGNVNADPLSENSDSAAYYRKVLQHPNEFDVLINKVLPGDSVAYAIDSTTAGLWFTNYLDVVYTRKREPDEYAAYLGKKYGEPKLISQVYLPNGRPVAISANGMYAETMDMITMGYWAWWEKLGNMLPFDYVVP